MRSFVVSELYYTLALKPVSSAYAYQNRLLSNSPASCRLGSRVSKKTFIKDCFVEDNRGTGNISDNPK